LGFTISYTEADEEDLEMTFEEMDCEVFCQALRTIGDHPLLSDVKRVQIRYREYPNDFDLRRAASEFGRLFKNVGPLDVLTIYGGGPQSYLAPFLDLPDFTGLEQPIVYPPIKELRITHPFMTWRRDECLGAIVELAKSQYMRGIPFKRIKFRTGILRVPIADRLRPWIDAVDCCEGF
jgi:hypothetical protein